MDLQSLTLKQARKDIDEKKYSSKELTEESLSRLEHIDPQIKAFVSVTREEALRMAEKADSGDVNSNIAGLPGSIKDNFNWTGTKTTASSKMLKDYVSPYDATVTRRILNSGGVLIGKTNLDAFAHGSSTETSDFFTTRNPWDLERLPGGSSGGSAAAVAAGLGLYSIGSETAGSIRVPAAWCGLTGLKATYGRISRYGVIAMGSSLDTPSPIAKSAEDCAILLDIIAGQDPKDATSSPRLKEKFYENLNTNISGMKIGLPKQYFDEEKIDSQVLQKVNDAIKMLESLGATVWDMDLMDPKYGVAAYTVICRAEVSSNLGRYDGIRYGYSSDREAESIIEKITYNRGEGFGNEAKQRSMTGAYALSAGYHDAYYKKAQKVRTLIRQDLENALDEYDVIIGPTLPGTAPKLGATEGDPMFGEMTDILTMASSLSGTTGISVPVGFDDKGLPIGMNIMAGQFEEQKILNMSHAYQRQTDHHKQFTSVI